MLKIILFAFILYFFTARVFERMMNNKLGDLNFIVIKNPAEDLHVTALIDDLNQSLEVITGASGSKNAVLTDFEHHRALFVIGLRDENAVACGGFRPVDRQTCEIKRMFSNEKGKGIGGQLLAELERQAGGLGYTMIQLETRRINQGAVNFYLSNGYQIIDNYGIYQGRAEAVCFAKRLC